MQVFINWANTSLFIILDPLPTLKLPIKSHPSSRELFFWCSFSIKLSWLQRRSKKVNTILYDRYYLKNYKASTLIENWKSENMKKLTFEVIFLFYDSVLIKQIIVSSTPFCCWEKKIFEKMLPWGMSNFFLPMVWWQELGDKFWVGRGKSINASNQCIF